MDCQYSEKVSLLIDGELPSAEAELVIKHIDTCPACKQTKDEFLRLGQQVRSYDFEPDLRARQRALNAILDSQKLPLWRRTIEVPAPAFALMIVALLALAYWAVSPRIEKRPEARLDNATAGRASQEAPAAIDFSRFDSGERAAIFTAKRAGQGSDR